jgi:hypothetical protein
VRAVRCHAVRMLTIRRQVDDLTGLDEAELDLVPPLQRTIQHDERLRFASVHVAGGHASKPGPLLDH